MKKNVTFLLLFVVYITIITGCNNQKGVKNSNVSPSPSHEAIAQVSGGAVSSGQATENSSVETVTENIVATGSAVKETSPSKNNNSKQTGTPLPIKNKSNKKSNIDINKNNSKKNNTKKDNKKNNKKKANTKKNDKKDSKKNNKNTSNQKTPQVTETPKPIDNFKGTKITLGNTIEIEGPGASANGNIVKITKAGSYRIQGTLSNGQIILHADKADFNIELAGVSIKSSNGPAILVSDAHLTKITLKSGTNNYIEDGGNVLENDAALFCDDDLMIDGNGTLVVKGNNSEGIETNETLTINGGIIKIAAKDDGINAKSQIIQNAGSIYTESSGNGFDSNGSIHINGGTITAYAGADKSPITPGDTAKVKINGGTVFAVGGKLSSVDTVSTQYSFKIKTNISANKSFRVLTGSTEIFTIKPSKTGSRVWFSSPLLKGNTKYGIFLENVSIGTISTTEKCVSLG